MAVDPLSTVRKLRHAASVLVLFTLCACGQSSSLADDVSDDSTVADESALLRLTHPDPGFQLGALERIDREWQDNFTPAMLEYISLSPSPTLQKRGLDILRKRTGQDFGFDLNTWFAWVWMQQFELPPDYPEFKSRLYRRIDVRFGDYFSRLRSSTIRLDEVRWGGVLQDGIPPLRNPDMIPAGDADYLEDDNIVFGIEVDGDVRAYPKRILAWHEMFVDTVGAVPVVGVYCTLCGSMILYESAVDGVQHEMGTSGFLYRSNKLMFDQATYSLWNTMWGTPAIGPLVGQDIRLPRRSVVTTTWGEWRRRHPETTVLSLNTGFRRDYGEGVAYQEYFATDELMFNSSQVDNRLPNKAEVLGLVFSDSGEPPLAISASYANENPIIHERIGDRDFVVITDGSGAMRVYESGGRQFVDWDRDVSLRDSNGQRWTVHEDRLQSEDGAILQRLPSHNAFWFGWFGAYTNTRLLH
ncbi:MAG: DUF3179 domain-containing protein [Woeseiaceae bacterium]|nr:DUF3179 domain-containing protein [Woeseiaceae bacterium]